MKRFLFIFLIFFVCIPCRAHGYSVNENYDSMNFEIIDNNKVVFELSFERFRGYQQIENKIFFIDCSKSKISEYGELCYFDCDLMKIKYTNIFSGSSFCISEDSNYLIVSALYESKKMPDIEDVFGLGIQSKKFPLNISVYDFNIMTKLKEYSFVEKLDENKLENYYIEIISLSNDEIKIQYGIYDTTQKIDCGVLEFSNLL